MYTQLSAALLAVVTAVTLSAPATSFASTESGRALPTLALDNCSWDRPGINPFMGDVVAAVDRYRDIPPEVRERLKARMAKRDYDDMVSIRRDSIKGQKLGRTYGSTISEMHFGTHQLCRSVTRNSWTPAMQERGLVYCESGQCILVPTVCRNVSRISRREVSPDHAEGPAEAGLPETPVASSQIPPATDLLPGPIGSVEGVPLLADASNAGLVPALGSFVAGGGPLGFVGAGGAGFGGPSELPGSLPLSSGPSSDGSVPVTPVPEPQTWALMAAGLVGLMLLRRRRRARAKLPF